MRRLIPRTIRHRIGNIIARSRAGTGLNEITVADVEYCEGVTDSATLLAICHGKRAAGVKGVAPPVLLDPEALHDRDWLGTKADDTFFEQASRYPDIADVISRLQPRRLLDVGCGSGYLAKLLKARVGGLVIHGVDISSVALERARSHVDQVWQVDLDKANLPLPSEEYDTVTCVEVIEHLYDPEHALREIARVLVPGGRAVVTVPNLAYWRFRLALLQGRVPPPAVDPRHLHQFDSRLFAEALSRAGLRLVAMTGHSLRLDWIARRRPDLFSDILIATVVKP
jgi:methionine biosynthesis protein MetW